jgi:transcriptional regulator with XRE-family HTH domain
MNEATIHEGHNVRFFRQALGMKQDQLVDLLGPGWSQAKLSKIESKAKLEEDELKKIADALSVSPELIERFDQQSGMNIIHNTFSQFSNGAIGNAYQPVIHPVDQLIAVYERQLKELKEEIAELRKELRDQRK